MDYQTQIDKLRKQFQDSIEALDQLDKQLKTSDIPYEQNNNDLQALVAYLALGTDIKDDRLLTMILQSAMYVVGASGAGLTLLDPETNTLVFKAAIGDGAEGIIGYQVPLEGSQHGLAFATGEVQSSTPINTDIEDSAKTHFRNVLVAPLFINEDGVGTISAVNKQNGEHFTPADMQAYQHFAGLAAMVVRQRQREEMLKDLLAGKARPEGELAGIHFNEDDKQLMSILQDVMRIAKRKNSLLPVCKKLTELLADMSNRSQW